MHLPDAPSDSPDCPDRGLVGGPDSAPPGGLRERNKHAKRHRIVAAAAELFEKQGFEKTTAREISRVADIGTGTLFNYVRDKRELLFLVFEAGAARRLDEVERAAARKHDVVEGLMAVFGPFIEFYAERPDLSRHFARELFFRRSEETHGMAALNARLLGAIAGVLRRGMDSGRLREDLPIPDAVQLVMAQYALWIQNWLGMENSSYADVRPGLRRGLRLSVEGMAREGAPASTSTRKKTMRNKTMRNKTTSNRATTAKTTAKTNKNTNKNTNKKTPTAKTGRDTQ